MVDKLRLYFGGDEPYFVVNQYANGNLESNGTATNAPMSFYENFPTFHGSVFPQNS
jgi:hypothetical protein